MPASTPSTAPDSAPNCAPAWRSAGRRPWLIVAITLGALVSASAFRSSTGALIQPLEEDFGWSRNITAGAVSLNLVLYGIVAPFAAAAMERWGLKPVAVTALITVGTASALTTVMTSSWQLWLLWGLMIGTATGSMAIVFGAMVAQRWFTTRRGLATGIFSAASATGQLLFLPAITALAHGPGWRLAALVVTVAAFLMAAAMFLFFADRPEDLGLVPHGSDPATYSFTPTPSRSGLVRSTLHILRTSSRIWAFWVLTLTFWVCGWSTNGLVQTHFIPAAHDHGMPPGTAAWLLAVIGIFDIAGTIASGWFTDRFDPRKLLLIYYAGRGISLMIVHDLLGPSLQAPIWAFIVFYGLDWVATVPPTVALCREHFGLEKAGVVFGWVFASHMVGAGVGASVAGFIRTSTGSYELAWYLAAGLCFVAAGIAMTIRHTPARH